MTPDLTSLQSKKPLTLGDFSAMQQLESEYYSANYITPAAEAYAWYLREPASTLARFDAEGRLAGFVNLFAVEEEIFSALLAGRYNDSTLTADDLTSADGAEHLFLSCITVAPQYRGSGLSAILLREAMRQYTPSPGAKIVCDNVTEAGARFSERCGLRFLRRSDHDSSIYCGTWKALWNTLESQN